MAGRAPKQPEALFAELVSRFSALPSVTPPTGEGARTFGASALKTDGKIFAMLANGELVVKLPRQRVDELVASGAGRPFDSGRGRIMKEWVTVAPDHGDSWAALAEEAREFVAAAAATRR